ncbi:Fur-regulated basic protein B [Anoxybacillus vitaminiphilus]|uniref:Fur-regulated basic protein B n=1 Tax=Paranoxybacillus vitaminiphilus TaxID=581036 RepID=A0A327YBG6_9BACL|nr:FbpB family small basic protein [Anoxybacillus vitaminiphilus]RAK18468.1 Fur-regulated basic protein B [Anoxybacillus vitaminiphilus]
MRKIRKVTLEELILENKQQLLNDREAMERIEEKLEERILKKVE